MKFEKYHGLGNDFIIFNMKDVREIDHSDLAQKVCHRNFGVGADGMIIYEEGSQGIVMNFYNADGTTAPMCGNGIRCFTHYMKNNGLFTGNQVDINTGAGRLQVAIDETPGEFRVRVNMGRPEFRGKAIPIREEADEFIERVISVEGREVVVSSLFMGTTHTVVFVDDLKRVNISELGPKIEAHEMFPVKTNVNFCEVVSEDEMHVTTWERGAGMTLACGTGACGAVVVAEKLGKTGKKVRVRVPGGELFIEREEDIYMTGPSVKIAEGEYIY